MSGSFFPKARASIKGNKVLVAGGNDFVGDLDAGTFRLVGGEHRLQRLLQEVEDGDRQRALQLRAEGRKRPARQGRSAKPLEDNATARSNVACV